MSSSVIRVGGRFLLIDVELGIPLVILHRCDGEHLPRAVGFEQRDKYMMVRVMVCTVATSSPMVISVSSSRQQTCAIRSSLDHD
jgi:hypothetical protein